ncbi:MAG: preprotein translocase subunit SecG [Eggerthellaceae bacterium]|nr:preprotein translocase subunit SecG [Eggerthellaceae bacterium]
MEFVDIFRIIMIILQIISGICLIIFILLHSGKGTGINDMIASSVYSQQSGTGLVEKNLDRITIICAIIFFACLLTMMVIYPMGSLATSA